MVIENWSSWAAVFQTVVTITANAFVSYLVTKHLIKGVYEEQIEKRLRRKKK